MVLSIQGPHAVGKTTLLRKVKEMVPTCLVAHEPVVDSPSQPDREHSEDEQFHLFCDRQRKFIDFEIARYRAYPSDRPVIVDRGPETTAFYTITYPTLVGAEWPVRDELRHELHELEMCYADTIVYLTAPDSLLIERAQGDGRERPTHRRWLEHFEPRARKWFANFRNVTYIDTSVRTPETIACIVASMFAGKE